MATNAYPTSAFPQDQSHPVLAVDAYVAPAIEAVVTLEELEREVHYAGDSVTPSTINN